jgi:phytanoyl-CoA hydroxylase
VRAAATPDEIASYQENGFVVIPDLLTAEELEEWRAAVDEAVSERGRLAIPGFAPRDEKAELTYYEKVFTQRVNLWQTNESLKALMLDERIGKLATELAGVDGIRIYHDQALIKEPWANPTGFHLDVPYWAFSSPDAISIWIALDDATMQNGALMFIPGSHKTVRYDNAGIGPSLGDLFTIYPEWGNVMPVAVPMKAGSCSFHNGLTAHGAGANMTPGRRRAMTAGFMPDGSTFNGKSSIYRPEQLATMAVGDVLDDETQTPLLYSRSATASASGAAAG